MKNWKLVTLSLIVILGVAACSNQKDSKPEIGRASKGTASPAGTRAKPTGENTPQDVLELLKTLEMSHQMFQQVWLHVWPQGRQEIESPFFALKKRLLRHQKGNSGWIETFEQCPQYASKLVIQKQTIGGRELISKLKLTRVSCQNRVSSDVAEITFKPQEILIKMHRGHFRDGFGISLETVGGTAQCRILLNAQKKMESLKCVGLGQNRESETHVVFDHFEYSRSSQKMMIIRGSKYRKFQKSCEVPEPRPCIDITVPLTGAIRISENLVRTEDREQYEKELRRIEFENKKIESANNEQTRPAKPGAKPGQERPVFGRPAPEPLDGEMTDTRNAPVSANGLRTRQTGAPGAPAQTAPTEQPEPKPMSERELRDRLGLRPEEPLPEYVRPVVPETQTAAPGQTVVDAVTGRPVEPETMYTLPTELTGQESTTPAATQEAPPVPEGREQIR